MSASSGPLTTISTVDPTGLVAIDRKDFARGDELFSFMGSTTGFYLGYGNSKAGYDHIKAEHWPGSPIGKERPYGRFTKEATLTLKELLEATITTGKFKKTASGYKFYAEFDEPMIRQYCPLCDQNVPADGGSAVPAQWRGQSGGPAGDGLSSPHPSSSTLYCVTVAGRSGK